MYRADPFSRWRQIRIHKSMLMYTQRIPIFRKTCSFRKHGNIQRWFGTCAINIDCICPPHHLVAVFIQQPYNLPDLNETTRWYLLDVFVSMLVSHRVLRSFSFAHGAWRLDTRPAKVQRDLEFQVSVTGRRSISLRSTLWDRCWHLAYAIWLQLIGACHAANSSIAYAS